MSRLISLVSFILLTVALQAQFRGQNLVEYQYGKMPDEAESEFSSLFNRVLADYSIGHFRLGLTVEQYYTPFSARNFTSLSQFRLYYSSGPFEVRLGNFYETLGRGLLLRSYEIPGALLEEKSYRAKHYFHRDISGGSVRYRKNNFSAVMLYGKPLNNAFPPGMSIPCRRPDNIAAVQSDYNFGGQIAGASLLTLENSAGRTWYSMVNISGNLGRNLSYYAESARRLDGQRITDFSGEASWALYGALNFSFSSTGLSLEYKNYKDFQLGAGFNEPPALVREHSYRVLNRSTHVSQALDETGYQAEAFWMLPDASVITLNHTIAVNDLGRRFVFREYFIEYSGGTGSGHELRIFAGLAEDPIKQESNRVSTGSYTDWRIGSDLVLSTNFEYQRFDRDDYIVRNMLISPGINIRPRLGVAMITELSNDPFLIDKPENSSAMTKGQFRWWTGGTISYRIRNNHNLQVFAGQRRGGPACHSGICYDILDFTGLELRLTSRF